MEKGSLDKLLVKVGKLSDVILGEITYQILLGLAYLHKSLKIIHRDIKPGIYIFFTNILAFRIKTLINIFSICKIANILINNKGGVKIADLGICGKIENTLD